MKRRQAANAACGTALRTHQEIAAKMGISRARAFQLEQRALAKLRLAIAREAEAAGMTVREWLETV